MTQYADLGWIDPITSDAHPNQARRRPALGSDPFAEVVDRDPFLEGLGDLDRAAGSKALVETQNRVDPQGLNDLQRLDAPDTAIAVDAIPAEAPLLDQEIETRKARHAPTPNRSNWIDVPKVEDVELPERTGWIDRMLTDDERRRIASLAHLAEGEVAYDRFGFSPDVLRNTLPIVTALYRIYFRVESHGHENIPAVGPAILAGNHAGVLPFDATMVATDLILRCDPPRLARTIVDRWAGGLPWVNIFYARGGQVVGTQENFGALLESGQVVVVLPEGMRGAVKPISERYRLQKFSVGFIEQALRTGAPVIPTAIVGSDDQMPTFFDLGSFTKRFGLPALPITPTFPWFGPLGILPYPVRYKIFYGAPLEFGERYGPDDARDPELVRFLSRQVRRSVQRLIDQNR